MKLFRALDRALELIREDGTVRVVYSPNYTQGFVWQVAHFRRDGNPVFTLHQGLIRLGTDDSPLKIFCRHDAPTDIIDIMVDDDSWKLFNIEFKCIDVDL